MDVDKREDVVRQAINFHSVKHRVAFATFLVKSLNSLSTNLDDQN